MEKLEKECDRVVADCIARKGRLDKALIWEEEEEQVTELKSSSVDGKLMDTFYTTLSNGCVNWYDDASTAFGLDAKNFSPYISEMGDNKYLMMQYSRKEFQTIKDKFFTIVDGLRDSQRVIESTQEYFGGKSLKLMKKRVDNKMWKYQLKYSTKMTKRCENDVEQIEKF